MKKKYNPIQDMEPMRDSFILYAAWYTCISAFSPKSQALAFKAICEYALFDIPIPKVGFSRLEYSSLISFIPVLDSNRRRYENGKKGALHGSKGGRPKKDDTPMGLYAKTPLGILNETPNFNENVKFKENICVGNDTQQTPTFSYIYSLLLPVFFFKNCDAKIEIKRFYEHYTLSNWRMSGGERLNTPNSLVVAAERWKVLDPKPYFPVQFLESWREVYTMSPEYLRKDLVEIKSISRQQSGITLVCSANLYNWLLSPEIHSKVLDLLKQRISKSYKLELLCSSNSSKNLNERSS